MKIFDTLQQLSNEIYSLEGENERLSREGKALSDAYIWLRALIPGALDTPFAPSPQVVWKTTEDALKRLVEKANGTSK